MRAIVPYVMVAALALAGACKKEEAAPVEPDVAAVEVPVAEEPMGAEPVVEQPDMINNMANCPNAVQGAETGIAVVDSGIAVSITAQDEAAIADIRKRAQTLASLDDVESAAIEHTGKGTGGGTLGQCPVVMANTDLTVEEVDGGVKVTVTAPELGADALRAEAEKRLAALKVKPGHEGHGSGTGGGMGGHGGEGKGS